MSNPTPEPRTEPQDDPWKGVKPFRLMLMSDLQSGASEAVLYHAEQVDIARAAVESRHAEEIAAKEREVEEWMRIAAQDAADHKAELTTLRNRVVDLSEQGDTLTRLLAAVAAELPPLVEGDTPEGRPLAEHVRRLRDRAYRAEGDAETLREQLAERDAAANVYRGIADALREQLAAVQQAAREVCPAEDSEDGEAHYVCVGEEGTPIIEADNLAGVIRQMSDLWLRSQKRYEDAEAQLAAVQQERDEKAAMHNELAALAGSAIVLATLDTLAGERPTQEPEHALPAAVWRLVQDRDEARAANTANLREMVGMAGRFRQTLQTVRACIVALTPGHRTGYDWNADPLYLTRKEGEALSAIDAALSSPSTQEPHTVCEKEPR